VAHLIALRRHLLPHPEFFRPLFKWVQGPRTRFVSVSRGADGVLDSWGVDQRWRYRVPNGVALPERWTSRETRDLRRELGVPEEALLITMVANFHPIKGHPELIRALALLPKPTSPPTQKGRATRAMSSSPEAWLCLVGDGRLLDHCRSLASDLGVAGRVVFAGHRGDIPRILQASDIFVLNSKSEGMSNALLEAIAAGLPCIATGVGGNPEVVADGVNGFLVPPNDAPALARRLAVLIQDPELRRVMGARSDEKARREFSFESMVAKTEAIYDEILAWQEARRTSR